MAKTISDKKFNYSFLLKIILPISIVGIIVAVITIMSNQHTDDSTEKTTSIPEQAIITNKTQETEIISEDNDNKVDEKSSEETKTDSSKSTKANEPENDAHDITSRKEAEETKALGEKVENQPVQTAEKTADASTEEVHKNDKDATLIEKSNESPDEENIAEAEAKAAEIARKNTIGNVAIVSYNTYPYRDHCPQESWHFTGKTLYAYGGYICENTSYSGWKAYEYYGISINAWGNAKDWGNSALAHGYTYDSNPELHVVGFSTAGAYGHTVWVEAINDDGTIDVSEYNNSYSSASGSIADYGYRTHVAASSYKYIHFTK